MVVFDCNIYWNFGCCYIKLERNFNTRKKNIKMFHKQIRREWRIWMCNRILLSNIDHNSRRLRENTEKHSQNYFSSFVLCPLFAKRFSLDWSSLSTS